MKAILAGTILALVVLVAVAMVASGQNAQETLIAMKSDDSLSPQMDPDPESEGSQKVITADYDDLIIIRANRRPVDAGTWSVDITGELSAGASAVHIWYKDEDEGYNNDPNWEANIYVDGSQVAGGSVAITGDANEPREVVIDLNSSVTVSNGQSLEVKLTYTGWENARLYYDCVAYPSGWKATCAALIPIEMTASKSKVNLVFVDIFSIGWATNDWLYVYAHPASDAGGAANPEYRLSTFTTLIGEPYPLGNGSKAQTILQFDAKLGDGKWVVGARFQYNNESFVHELSVPVSFDKDNSGNPLEDLPGFEAPLIAIALLSALLVMRRRR